MSLLILVVPPEGTAVDIAKISKAVKAAGGGRREAAARWARIVRVSATREPYS